MFQNRIPLYLLKTSSKLLNPRDPSFSQPSDARFFPALLILLCQPPQVAFSQRFWFFFRIYILLLSIYKIVHISLYLIYIFDSINYWEWDSLRKNVNFKNFTNIISEYFTNEKFSVNDDFSLAKVGIETISGIKKITSFFILFSLLAD